MLFGLKFTQLEKFHGLQKTKVSDQKEIFATYHSKRECLCRHPEKNSSLALMVASWGLCIRINFSRQAQAAGVVARP